MEHRGTVALGRDAGLFEAARRWMLSEQVLWPSLLFLCLLALLRWGGFDDFVMRLFFDAGSSRFPLKHAFWNERVLHDGGRALMVALGVALAVSWLASLFLRRLQRWRRPLGYLAAATLASVLLVSSLKQVSNLDCPWDLQDYGGSEPYYGLFDDRPDDLPRARCFPGGHSSSAFAWFGLYFLARSRRQRRAALMILPPLLVGTLFAAGQWMRGAHFPSHDLTTAYLCWMVAWTLQGLLYQQSPRCAEASQAAK